MNVHIPDDLAQELQKKAEFLGTDPEHIAIRAIKRTLASDQRFDELLAPVRDAFQQSGMTEDEAVELFEAEKHAMRQERTTAAS